MSKTLRDNPVPRLQQVIDLRLAWLVHDIRRLRGEARQLRRLQPLLRAVPARRKRWVSVHRVDLQTFETYIVRRVECRRGRTTRQPPVVAVWNHPHPGWNELVGELREGRGDDFVEVWT